MAWSDEARAAALAARRAHAKSSGTANKGSKSSTHTLTASMATHRDAKIGGTIFASNPSSGLFQKGKIVGKTFVKSPGLVRGMPALRVRFPS